MRQIDSRNDRSLVARSPEDGADSVKDRNSFEPAVSNDNPGMGQ